MILVLIAFLLLPGVSFAQSVDIGILEDVNRAYITANREFEVIEDRSTEQGSFVDSIVLLERKAGQEVLLRSAPATDNDLVVASAPDLNSTNSNLLFKCKGYKRKNPSRKSHMQGLRSDEERSLLSVNERSRNKRNAVDGISRTGSKPCIFTVKQYKGDKNRYVKFKGEILIKPSEKTFTVINRLELEEYLRGVVPGEMPVSWPLEALKAQAVAARTYTLKNLERRKVLGYDLKASVEDQMYKGLKAEDSRTNKAIKLTEGEYLKDKQGLVVNAYYSSHAGKFTASPEDGWGLSPKHYLIPVKEAGSQYPWQKVFSTYSLSQKLKDLGIGNIKAVTVVEYSPEGRARRVLVSASVSHRLLTGEEFRHQLGLKSTMFSLALSPSRLVVNGYGFGHGIGMSQHGAKHLAQQGKTYKEILARYYSEASL